jgi:hypothetical protein
MAQKRPAVIIFTEAGKWFKQNGKVLVIEHIAKEIIVETSLCAIKNTYILRIKSLQYINNTVLLYLCQERKTNRVRNL